MKQDSGDQQVGVLVSGGLDSCILVGQLLARRQSVQPIYVRSEFAWQEAEERALRRFLDALASPRLSPLVVLDQPIGDIYGQHWSLTGQDVPDEWSADEAVYLPGRNALLVIKPALWCQMRGIDRLLLAPLAQSPFEDAARPFFSSLQTALNFSSPHAVCVETPFAGFSKLDVMRLGERLPLELTFSCISPRGEEHCGACNKCAERRRAFQQLGVDDPTRYVSMPQVAG